MNEITLNHISKVEGHASLVLEIKDDQIKRCELKAIEGARFFEGMLKGRSYWDAKEITSRICGICSVGHNLTSLKATEAAFGITPSKQTQMLRELLSIGERIRSHATHLYFLALPDYLNYESALSMLPKYKKEVTRALSLVKLGNNIVRDVAGREMHTVSTLVGGFSSIPRRENMLELQKRLKDSLRDSIATAELFLKLNHPLFERETEYMALRQLDGFPHLEGKMASNKGFECEQKDYHRYLEEYIEPYATSKFAVREGREYMTGALSRVNNSYKLLSNNAEKLLKKSKIKFPSHNPFHNNVAQAIELVHWTEQAIDIIDRLEFKAEGLPNVKPKAGRGIAITEVPRGMCIHDYTYDSKGYLKKANILTPTCQNLRNMEADIRSYVPALLDKSKDEIIRHIEMLIRAYDPCFSCSTHFLKVDWKRS